ncbi:hypothetical protein [Cupriavidus necator]|nr:hypothetical protein [Cupriavidus necator]MDX6008776.1 hypothetical protein [Cupriavidus necator]
MLAPLKAHGFFGHIEYSAPDPLLWMSIVGGNQRIGFRWIQLLHAIEANKFWILKPLTITPHAIARCLQRVGTMDVPGILEPISLALGFAIPLMSVSHQEKWRQFAVPVREGLFLGDSGPDGWVIRTYISRKPYEHESGWDKYLNLFPEIPRWSPSDLRNISVSGRWMTEQLMAIRKERLIVDRVSRLAKQYERREDKQGEQWRKAKSQRDRDRRRQSDA